MRLPAITPGKAAPKKSSKASQPPGSSSAAFPGTVETYHFVYGAVRHEAPHKPEAVKERYADTSQWHI